ncbi:HesA/MoeB/ThiF family protein [Cytobacillus sp. Bac17]|uniref:HesA/MoeB/ThiF family protein n=1 Tax=Cytobacillus sp. Bac17 TaxID=2926008 RepID=UPI0021181993|nr:HesA/MoeB/ThiF family protein [Cytobacillus sp. Bac17]
MDSFERYSRQIILSNIGIEGQEKLQKSRVLVIGAGGLAATALAYLASAGVGTIGIVDGDRVELSNLQRQIIHFESDLGKLKTKSASDYIKQLNSQVYIKEYPVFLTNENAELIISQYDVIINGTDNFPTRYLVNDYCVLLGKPLVDASIVKYEGQASVYLPDKGCYRCLYPIAPSDKLIPNCSEVGVLGPIAGIFGSVQAMETIKILLGMENLTISDRLIIFDLLNGNIRTIKWKKNKACPICGDNPSITKINSDYNIYCKTEVAQQNIEDWSIDLAHLKSIKPAPRVLDLRNSEDAKKLFLSNSSIVSYDDVLSAYDSWDRDLPIVFVCDIGLRSSSLTELLRMNGFKNVFNLRGGIIKYSSELYQ